MIAEALANDGLVQPERTYSVVYLPSFHDPSSTMAKRKRLTALKAIADLEENPGYQRGRREVDDRLERQREEWHKAEGPVLEALASAGVTVATVWDLVNSRGAYPDAVSVLVEHLGRPYPPLVLESIARALAVPEARQSWAILLDYFSQRDEPKGNGVKWALGCALTGAADDSVIDDVIELVADPVHGENRIILLSALAKSKLPEAGMALKQAAQDPQLAAEATHLLKKVEKRRERQTRRRSRLM